MVRGTRDVELTHQQFLDEENGPHPGGTVGDATRLLAAVSHHHKAATAGRDEQNANRPHCRRVNCSALLGLASNSSKRERDILPNPRIGMTRKLIE